MFTSRAFVFLTFFIAASPAHARVFDINTENFSSYLRLQQGTNSLEQKPFAPSSGANTVFDGTYSTQQAYEFGFIYASKYMNMRFGFELLRPPNMQTLKGSSSAGVEWYTLNNNINIFIPKIGIEANLKQWKQSRIFLSVDVGQASATIENSYKFTLDGNAQFGLANFREEVKGSGTAIEYSVGYEMLAFDSTTIALDAGYRQLQVASFTHNAATTTFQGDVAKGTPALNRDGTARAYDFGGVFASVWLRFWIQ